MTLSRAVDGFDDAQCDALERLVAAVRRLNDATVSVGGSAATLDALTAEVERAEAALRRHASGKPIPRYRYGEFREQQLNELLPYSPATGHFSPHALPVRIERDGDRIVGHSNFTDVFEGPPGCVHGGIISLVYDQILAMAPLVAGLGGHTGSLTVHYRKTTPLHQDLVWTAFTERVDGRKVHARGTCHLGGELLTEAEGLFIRVKRPD